MVWPCDGLFDSWMTSYRSDAERAYQQDQGLQNAYRQVYSLEIVCLQKQLRDGGAGVCVNPILRNSLSGHKQYYTSCAAVSLLYVCLLLTSGSLLPKTSLAIPAVSR